MPCDFIPRSALTIPHEFVHLTISLIPGAGIGVFSSVTIPRGVRFGPYRGLYSQNVRSMYCWQIKSTKSYIDASDENNSNWLRYVNCARNYHEQNLVAHYYRGEVYYSSIKIIPRDTELLVFYGCEFALELDVDLRIYNDYNLCTSDGNDISDRSYEPELKEISFKQNIEQTLPLTTVNITESNSATNQNLPNLSNTNKSYNETPDTTNKVYRCEICNKTFNKQYSLKQHKITHLTYKLYSCTYCGFKTKFFSNVKRHTNTHHTKETVYQCNFCIKIYYSKSSLDKHRRIHLK